MHIYFNDSDNTVAAVEHFAAQIHCAVHAIAGYGVNVTNVNWTEHIRSDDEFEFDTFIRVSFMKVSHGETKCIWSWNGIMCASFLWSKKSTAVAVDAFTSFAHILQLVFHCMIDSVVYTFKTVAQSFNLPGRPRHPSGSIFFFFVIRFGGFDTRKFYLFCQRELARQTIHAARHRFLARHYIVECSCGSVRCTKRIRCIEAASLQSMYSMLIGFCLVLLLFSWRRFCNLYFIIRISCAQPQHIGSGGGNENCVTKCLFYQSLNSINWWQGRSEK